MNKKWVGVYILILFFLGACEQNSDTNRFTLKGDLENIDDQEIYLEQLFFSEQPPQVLDTGNIRNGEFEVSTIASEEGMYRIRFEKLNSGYIFINDKSTISLKADVKDETLNAARFESPANIALMNMLTRIDQKRNEMLAASNALDTLKSTGGADSLIAVNSSRLTAISSELNQYISKYIDTTTQPVIALFALGYTQGIDPTVLKTVIPNLAKRFPNHQGITGVVNQYNAMIAEQNKPASPAAASAGIGSMAPDFTMTDTEGKPFSLSQLKGKYVLVDFWASWCAPCRAENPNVVAAYNQFKDKNFTILGVSLDDNKEKWLQAITSDNLTWKQVSDLKGWQNAAVNLYGFDGIPYNVLIDPKGKIIATTLREGALQAKLAEVLN